MMDKFISAEDVIGHMYATTEQARAIVELISSTYFLNKTAKEEDLLRIRVEWGRICNLLGATMELLKVAEDENNRWQQRPAEQIGTAADN